MIWRGCKLTVISGKLAMKHISHRRPLARACQRSFRVRGAPPSVYIGMAEHVTDDDRTMS
jgi:hypothetical protein